MEPTKSPSTRYPPLTRRCFSGRWGGDTVVSFRPDLLFQEAIESNTVTGDPGQIGVIGLSVNPTATRDLTVKLSD